MVKYALRYRRVNALPSYNTNSKAHTMNAPEPLLDRLVRSKFMILVIQFGVTGFLGLPLLWISSSFTRGEKWFWSIMITLYTSILIAIAVWSVYWAIGNLQDAGVI